MNKNIPKPFQNNYIMKNNLKTTCHNIHKMNYIEKKSNYKDTMDIIDFCKMKDIKYFPIEIRVENGKKKILCNARPAYRTNDFDYKKGQNAIIKRKELLNNGYLYTHIAIDTERVKQIDIDCREYDNIFKDLLKNYPNTKSTTKPYGRHIFVIDDSIKNEIKQDGKINRHKRVFKKQYGTTDKGNYGVELLHGLWAWCPIDAQVVNYKNSLYYDQNLNDLLEEKKTVRKIYNNIVKKRKENIKRETGGNKKIKIIYGLNDILVKNINKKNETNSTKQQDDILNIIYQYFDNNILNDRDLWRNFTYACSNLNISKKLWDDICIKYENYDLIENEKFYNNINPDHPRKCGWNTLINLTSLSNEMKELFKIVNGLSCQCEYTQIDYPDILYSVFGHDYLYSNGICCWNDDTKLWERDNEYLFDLQIKYFIKMCKNGYEKFINYKRDNYIDGTSDNNLMEIFEKNIENSIKEIKKLCNLDTINKIRKAFNRIIKHKNKTVNGNEIDYNIKSKSLIQFKNGCYDLKNEIFRERIRIDRASICLNWNYNDVQDENLIKILEKEIFKKIQPDKIQFEMMMAFLGYGLTGETREQKFMTNIGYTASNGKSLIQTMMCKAFDIYCYKVSGDIYSINSKYRQKELVELITRPIRMLFTGEMTDKKLDKEFIKDFVDGESINIKAVYHDSATVNHHAKLLQNSNHDLNAAGIDEGILRRCIIQFYKSKFIDEKEGKANKLKHIYIKNTDIGMWFNKDEYKLALFHLLKKYAKQYYEKRLIIHKDIGNNAKCMFEENNELSEKILQYYQITGNKKDYVNRKELYETCGLNYYEKREAHKFLKSKGIIYDRRKMINRKSGFYQGLKINSSDSESECENEIFG